MSEYSAAQLQKIAHAQIFASAIQFEKDGVCNYDNFNTENLSLYCDELARKMMRKYTASRTDSMGDFWDMVQQTINDLRTEYENPTLSRQLYDELSAILTDYEGNGGNPPSPQEMYDILSRIHNNWEFINRER